MNGDKMSRTSNIAVVIYRTGLIKLGFKSILLAVIAGKANQAVLRQLIREIHLNEASQHNDTNSETNSYLRETCGRISQRTDIAVITQKKTFTPYCYTARRMKARYKPVYLFSIDIDTRH